MSRRRWWMTAATLVLLALASSAVSVRNGFAYDDQYIIAQNAAVHSLHGWWRLLSAPYWPPGYGGDGYRPLTMLAFAVEWTIGNGAPWLFHGINVVLYCATTVAVFWLSSVLLPPAAAWVAAALFAVHPVHVEAVANCVGQSELLAALLLTVATALYLRGRRRGMPAPAVLAAIGALYFAACFAKEHAVMLPALLLAAELTVVRDASPWRDRLARLRPFALTLLLLGVAYLGVRSLIQQTDLAGFQPLAAFRFLHLTPGDRALTMVGVVPEWARLLLWPARLFYDYAPPYIDLVRDPSVAQLPGLLLLVGVTGLGVALRSRAPVISFGIAWLGITLFPVSNLVVATGVLVAERTLFLPSVGIVLGLAGAIQAMWPRLRTSARGFAVVGVGAVIAAGAARSAARVPVWRDNDRLFRQSVRDVPTAYHAHYMLGTWLFHLDDRAGGEREYRRALALFPYDPYLAFALADQYHAAHFCEPAIPLYRWTYELKPTFRLGRGDYSACLLANGQPRDARREALAGMAVGGENFPLLRAVLLASDTAMRNRLASSMVRRP